MKRWLILILICLCAVGVAAQDTFSGQVRVPLSFDYYYTYEMVVDALKKLNKAYPELTKARNRICLGPVGPGQGGPRKLSFLRCGVCDCGGVSIERGFF